MTYHEEQFTVGSIVSIMGDAGDADDIARHTTLSKVARCAAWKDGETIFAITRHDPTLQRDFLEGFRRMPFTLEVHKMLDARQHAPTLPR